MKDFEKQGSFYLGKIINPSNGKLTNDPLLYDSKDLTTHAVCVGMTGSGKTGLGITVLEEAALNNIPAIIIDPKGDLANLMLAFPDLSAKEFLPWIDEGEAERKGMKPEGYSEFMAKTWKDGLAKWGEDADRVKKFKNAAEVVIYTPASKAGVPISILSSFAAPSKELMLDAGALRDRVLSLTSSLLGLLGIDADPIKSREHILISTIMDQAWRNGKDLDIAMLIQYIQKPPFDKIGALDVDTFFPTKDRMALSIRLNNLLASPGFQAWLEGEPLDIKKLLYTKEGKPKLAILSIAHLSDSERMFFVTLVLNEMVSWMRRQPGTSSLRALLYMDEIFGYFPPTATPPSKLPMLTLLKQARAFGVGVVLCTQNPVDLDYKGLSNCGTWFIGKLQTERDKARVLEGLQVASNGELDAKSLEKMIALTGNRIFIMRSIHEKDPILFETRWTLSYLRGPLTLSQIESLTDRSLIPAASAPTPATERGSISENKPVLPPGIPEFFIRPETSQQHVHYKPLVLGIGKLHFVDTKNKVDIWQEIYLASNVDDDGKTVLWDEGEVIQDLKKRLDKTPLPDSTFDELPSGLAQAKNYAAFEKALNSSLYQNQTLSIFQAPELNLTSKDGESEADFRTRLSLALREKRDEIVKKINDKYADKISTLTEKLRRAQEKVDQKKEKAVWGIAESFLSFITTILGALFGRGVTKGTINQAGTSLRRVGRSTRESQDATQAEDSYQGYQQQLSDLQKQQQSEIDAISGNDSASGYKIETITIRPRKTDISIERVALGWLPTSDVPSHFMSQVHQ
jgi:hypothetical protein